jgi:hypothetical protein
LPSITKAIIIRLTCSFGAISAPNIRLSADIKPLPTQVVIAIGNVPLFDQIQDRTTRENKQLIVCLSAQGGVLQSFSSFWSDSCGSQRTCNI